MYKGRFAPSPTGPVHFGTLVAAVGSYLQAKKNAGQWFVRIEDVDTTRKVLGADADILNTLESFGFEWDGDIIYQSQRTGFYQQALDQLIEQSLVFPCLCSRKQLASTDNLIYPGTCRQRRLPEKQEHALRLRVGDVAITFNDQVCSKQTQNLKTECGDFVIKRRDQLFAYQLAVVVDDAVQGITEVVRGADLLDNTARQIYLQTSLGLPTPDYCHLPLVIDTDSNKKVSKSEGAGRVDTDKRELFLVKALEFLGQQPPADLQNSNVSSIWGWANEHWDISRVPCTTP